MTADHLEAFGRLIAARRPAVAARLLPGVPADEVRRRLGDVPDEVAAWFAWSGGVAGGETYDDVAIIPGYHPLSLDEALTLRPLYEGDEVLTPNWIPLLQGPGSDIYAAVWSGGPDAAVASVVVEEETEIEFAGVRQMVAVFTACYQRGVYGIGEDGRLEENDTYDEVYADVVDQVR